MGIPTEFPKHSTQSYFMNDLFSYFRFDKILTKLLSSVFCEPKKPAYLCAIK